MCRAIHEGGRRCPGCGGARSARERQRKSRARRALEAARAAGDLAAIAAAQRKYDSVLAVGAGAPAAQGPARTTSPVVAAPVAPTEQRVHDTVRKLVGRPGGWVSLTRLRAALSDIDRAEFDRVVMSMADRRDATLVSEANQKTLTAEDRAAGVDYGGEQVHLISFSGDLDGYV